MNCTMCGAIIPSGQSNCPMCGAPVQAEQPADHAQMTQQPIQPQQPVNPQMGYQQPMGQSVSPQMGYQQPMGQPVNPQMGYQQPMGQPVNPQMGYQQPMGQPMNPQMGQPTGGFYQPKSTGANMFGAGVNGYLEYLKSDPMNIAKIAGAILLFLATLIPWVKFSAYGVAEHKNLFGLGGFNRFIAILLLVLSLVLIAWEIADYIPQVAPIKAKLQSIPYFEVILLAVIFVFIIIATARHGYVHKSGTTISSKDWGIKASVSIGCIFAYLGVIAAAAPRVLDILGIQIGSNKFKG